MVGGIIVCIADLLHMLYYQRSSINSFETGSSVELYYMSWQYLSNLKCISHYIFNSKWNNLKGNETYNGFYIKIVHLNAFIL